MTTQFSVIKYVPDPVAGESINIGVIAFSAGESRIQFTENWHRAKAISKHPVSYLQHFARDFSSKQEQLFSIEPIWTAEKLQGYFSRWTNAIQFSDLRGSLKELDSLFPELVRLYLKDPLLQPRKKVVSKRIAANSTFQAATHTLIDKFGDKGSSLVLRSTLLPGRYDSHKVDVAIANGSLYGAAIALSFSVADTLHLSREIDAMAFAVEDLLAVDAKAPVAVAYIRPPRETNNFKRAQKIFTQLGAEFLPHENATIWAKKTALRIPANALEH